MDDIKKSVLSKKGKKFVIFGKSKWATEKQKRKMAKLKKLSEEEILMEYSKTAKGLSRLDHAVGITVDGSGKAVLIDNGFTKGFKEFSMYNLVDRMDDLCLCYEIDLYEE